MAKCCGKCPAAPGYAAVHGALQPRACQVKKRACSTQQGVPDAAPCSVHTQITQMLLQHTRDGSPSAPLVHTSHACHTDTQTHANPARVLPPPPNTHPHTKTKMMNMGTPHSPPTPPHASRCAAAPACDAASYRDRAHAACMQAGGGGSPLFGAFRGVLCSTARAACACRRMAPPKAVLPSTQRVAVAEWLHGVAPPLLPACSSRR